MEMSLFKKGGTTWTRFKVRAKEIGQWVGLLEIKYGVDTSSPAKVSSRFVYFEMEGDWLNG